MLPEPIKKFIDAFAGLPSIGPRQATRLAFYIKELGVDAVKNLASAVEGLHAIKTCALFFASHTSGDDACAICRSEQRERDTIAIVEKETDQLTLEKTKKFNGRYLVLGDLRKEGALEGSHKLRLSSLKGWIERELGGKAKEVILAINPTTYGDINATMISQELKNHAQKITRLGRGIPTGGEIEFADDDTLGDALKNRS